MRISIILKYKRIKFEKLLKKLFLQAVKISLGKLLFTLDLFFISYILDMWPYFPDHFSLHFVYI